MLYRPIIKMLSRI